MKMVIIVCIVLIVLIIIGIFCRICKNKFRFVTIKMDEALNAIDLHLQKKKELFERVRPIVAKELDTNDVFDYLENSLDLSQIEVNDLYTRAYNDLFKIIDDNDSLLKNEELSVIIDDINNNETDLLAAVKFYNDSAVIYNGLVDSFPSKIIAFFKRYKKCEFYNNKKRKIYDILNEE